MMKKKLKKPKLIMETESFRVTALNKAKDISKDISKKEEKHGLFVEINDEEGKGNGRLVLIGFSGVYRLADKNKEKPLLAYKIRENKFLYYLYGLDRMSQEEYTDLCKKLELFKEAISPLAKSVNMRDVIERVNQELPAIDNRAKQMK